MASFLNQPPQIDPVRFLMKIIQTRHFWYPIGKWCGPAMAGGGWWRVGADAAMAGRDEGWRGAVDGLLGGCTALRQFFRQFHDLLKNVIFANWETWMQRDADFFFLI